MKIEELTHNLSGVYRIVFDNQKCYIGISNDIKRRMIEHLNKDIRDHPELAICRAIKKHKIVDVEILEYIDPEDRERMTEREKYWIDYYGTYKDKNKGYNLTPGGDGASQGVHNNSASLTQEQLDKIVDLLLNSNYSYPDIAKQVGCNYAIINKINTGKHYRIKNLTYPLRESRSKRYSFENKTGRFFNKEDELRLIIEELKNPYGLTFKEINRKYNISISLIVEINYGRKYRLQNIEYPIRKKNEHCKRLFTKDEMDYIITSLKNFKIPMKEIADIIKCDRKVISDINQGIRQKQDNINYPIRKTSRNEIS